jgi:hypothetical protein
MLRPSHPPAYSKEAHVPHVIADHYSTFTQTGIAGFSCHCEERSDEAIPIQVGTSRGIASSLRSSQ